MKKILSSSLIILMATALFGCNKEEAPENVSKDLILSKYFVTLNLSTGKTSENVKIESGNDEYKVASSNKEVASVAVLGNDITVTAHQKGSASITVTDARNKKETIEVNVLQNDDDNPNPVNTLDYSVMSHVQYNSSTGTVYIASKFDETRDLNIWFRNSMFNDLMTFYIVFLENNPNEKPVVKTTRPPDIINVASSDNIGPIRITNVNSWFGGNHSFKENKDVKTAYTEQYRFYVDGKPLGTNTTTYARQIKVEVVNRLYEPGSPIMKDGIVVGFSDTMCKETVEYLIQEGSIEVSLTHEWYNKKPYTINRYYGMQSMAAGRADSVFFSRGNSIDFQLKAEIRGDKQDYPTSNRFVQKKANNEWYESCYLTSDGIGNHSMLDGDQFIFYNNGKTQKVYHGLISDKIIKDGNKYSWRGIYSWIKPLVDNDSLLAYIIKDSSGYIAIVDVKKPGKYEITIPEKIDFQAINLIDNLDNFSIDSESNKIVVNANNTGSCYISLIQQ